MYNYKVEGPRGVGLINYTIEDYSGSVYNFIVDLFNFHWGYHYDLGRAFGLSLPMEKNLNVVVGKKIGYELKVGKRSTTLLRLGAMILQAILTNRTALNKLECGYSSDGLVLLFGLIFHCFMALNDALGNSIRDMKLTKQFRLYWGYAFVGRNYARIIPGCITVSLPRIINKKLLIIMDDDQNKINAAVGLAKRIKFVTGVFAWDDDNLLAEVLKFIRGLDVLFSSYEVYYKRSFRVYLKTCNILLDAGFISKVTLLFVPVFDLSKVVVMSSHEKRYYFLHHFLPAFNLAPMLVYKLVGLSNRNAFGLVNKLVRLGYITDLSLVRIEMKKMLDALKANDFNMVVEVKSKPMLSRSYMGEPLRNGVKYDNY